MRREREREREREADAVRKRDGGTSAYPMEREGVKERSRGTGMGKARR